MYFRYPARADFDTGSKFVNGGRGGGRILHRELITNLHVRRELECGHIDHVRVGYIHKYCGTARLRGRGCAEFTDGDDGTSAKATYVEKSIYEIRLHENHWGKPRSNEKSSLKSRPGKTASSSVYQIRSPRANSRSPNGIRRGEVAIDSSPIFRTWRIYVENKSETKNIGKNVSLVLLSFYADEYIK